MKTTEEIRNDWHDIRSKLGNLICAIDGKEASLKSLDEAYERGLTDGTKCTKNRCLECGEYKKVFDDACEMAKKQSIGIGEMIKALERCANAFAGMEIRNWDGTYTQISYVLREAADMLAKINDSLERITE